MKHKLTLCLFICAAFSPAFLCAQKNTMPVMASNDLALVKTEAGLVKGYLHNGIFTYKGIPYADQKSTVRNHHDAALLRIVAGK